MAGCRSYLQPIIEGIVPAAGSRTAEPPGLILDAAASLLPKHDGEALVFLTSGPIGWQSYPVGFLTSVVSQDSRGS